MAGMTRAQIRLFYDSAPWRHLRKEVLQMDKFECQKCKLKGQYTKATHAHHVNYITVHPELALEKYYKDDEGIIKRNIIAVCKNCHDTVCHPERLRWNITEPLTIEKW